MSKLSFLSFKNEQIRIKIISCVAFFFGATGLHVCFKWNNVCIPEGSQVPFFWMYSLSSD